MVLRIEEGLSRGSDLARYGTKIDWTRPDIFMSELSGVVDWRGMVY